ncbi:MAG: ArsR/SmtB family transcription factor [Microbacteriaceae bacterium]
MADIFDVLADGTRRELLTRLERREGEVSVSELVSELGISQPTVSKHLKVLREAGLVTVREEGQHRYYRLDRAPFADIELWLAPFLAEGGSSDVTGQDAEAGPTVFAAWAGADVADRVGRAAADTAHSARVALEAAQEKLVGAQKRVSDKLPKWGR